MRKRSGYLLEYLIKPKNLLAYSIGEIENYSDSSYQPTHYKKKINNIVEPESQIEKKIKCDSERAQPVIIFTQMANIYMWVF